MKRKSHLLIILSTLLLTQIGICQKEMLTALRILNKARKDAGLSEVIISPELSKGCYNHARYLILNQADTLTKGLEAHNEYPSLKGYTKEGEECGKNAVINYVTPSDAVIGWLQTFYHRIPLLQPDLVEVGIGYYRKNGFEVSVLDCVPRVQGDISKDIVFYPNKNQVNIPLEMGPEIPHPVGHPGRYGFPVTIYFANWQNVTNVQFTLVDSMNHKIGCYVSTPEKPATFFPQWNSICAIPKDPLMPNQRYFVTVKAVVDGVPYSTKYSFKTVIYK
jgi:hypothetical protein